MSDIFLRDFDLRAQARARNYVKISIFEPRPEPEIISISIFEPKPEPGGPDQSLRDISSFD